MNKKNSYRAKHHEKAFILELLELLDNDNLSHIISWLPSGREFMVHDVELFKTKVFDGSEYKTIYSSYAFWSLALKRRGFVMAEMRKWSHPVLMKADYIGSAEEIRNGTNADKEGSSSASANWRNELVEDLMEYIEAKYRKQDESAILPQKGDEKFYLELLKLLENDEVSDIISWLPGGRQFKVHSIERLEELLAGSRYKRYSGWRRRLLWAGFVVDMRKWSHPVFIKENYIVTYGTNWQDVMVKDLVQYVEDHEFAAKEKNKPVRQGDLVQQGVPVRHDMISTPKLPPAHAITFHLLQKSREMLQKKNTEIPSICKNLKLDMVWNGVPVSDVIQGMIRERDELQSRQCKILECLIANPSMIDDYEVDVAPRRKRKKCVVEDLTNKISEAIEVTKKKREMLENFM